MLHLITRKYRGLLASNDTKTRENFGQDMKHASLRGETRNRYCVSQLLCEFNEVILMIYIVARVLKARETAIVRYS
jgi:hypothetical protein